MLLNKFRGCLAGVLVGDCLGGPFEGVASVSNTHVNNYFQQLLNPKLRRNVKLDELMMSELLPVIQTVIPVIWITVIPFKPYTDDTAMTKSVAESLLHNSGFNAEDMARRFTTQYFQEPKRGYGAAVHDVFVGLRMAGFEDVYYPAKKQFAGQGSFGNGAAMRVAPIALFSHKNISQLIDIATNSAKITHANDLAIRGALLQCFGIREALLLESDKELDSQAFVDLLLQKMAEFEKDDSKNDFLKLDGAEEEFRRSYVKKLKKVKEFLNKPEVELPPMEEIHNDLGVHVAALHSVPTALYCFLLGKSPIPGIQADNHFLRSILYAVSLGGDTDTIASMTGALVGAYLGFESIPKELLRHCEGMDTVLKLGEDLYDAVETTKQAKAGNE